MDYTTEMADGVRVVRVQGQWTGDAGNEQLRAALKEWLAAGERRFIFDLGGVHLITSVGLGSLVGAYSSCAREGAALRLAGLSERNRRVGYVSRILDLFDEFEDVPSALRSFKGPARG